MTKNTSLVLDFRKSAGGSAALSPVISMALGQVVANRDDVHLWFAGKRSG